VGLSLIVLLVLVRAALIILPGAEAAGQRALQPSVPASV